MKTVLIIEDNPEVRENTTEILELAGYQVTAVSNGREGLLLAQNCPDIILCDIMMPEVNGYEVIQGLKSDPSTAHIPFIYITASGERNEIKLAMEMGANGYLRKPFDAKVLLSLIEKCLG